MNQDAKINFEDQIEALDSIIDFATKLKDNMFLANATEAKNISIINIMCDEDNGTSQLTFFGMGQDLMTSFMSLFDRHPESVDVVKGALTFLAMSKIMEEDEEEEE